MMTTKVRVRNLEALVGQTDQKVADVSNNVKECIAAKRNLLLHRLLTK